MITIGDVAEVKGGKRLPKGKLVQDIPTAHRYIRVTDFTPNGVNEKQVKYIDGETQAKISRYTINTSDVYISIAGTIGLVGQVPESLNGANLTENAAKICEIKDTYSPKYIAYFLKSDSGKYEIKSRIVGTSQPKLALFRIKDIPLPELSIQEQQKIAGVLRAYDDLIENNSKRIEKLEAMARLLYRRYFEVPEADDWEIVKISDVLGKAPKSEKIQKSEYLENGSYPVIDQGKEFIAGWTNNEQTVITEKLPLIVFGDHTRIVKLAQEPFARGADGTQIITSDLLPPYYMYQTIKDLPLSNEHYARHFKILKITEIKVPPKKELLDFEQKVEPIFKQIHLLSKRNRRLAQSRDLLLPRLMSGEIEV